MRFNFLPCPEGPGMKWERLRSVETCDHRNCCKSLIMDPKMPRETPSNVTRTITKIVPVRPHPTSSDRGAKLDVICCSDPWWWAANLTLASYAAPYFGRGMAWAGVRVSRHSQATASPAAR